MSEGSPRQFWKSLAERDGAAAVLEASRDEFPEPPAAAATPNRRDFLAAAGFAFTGTMLAGCGNPLPRAPVRQALPLVDQPENVTPGRALHYASSCAACSAGCGLLVKTRDGRPIKLEGNPQHPLSVGGLCAVGQASLLGLYDRLAPRQPLHQGQDSSWTALDLDIRRRLDQLHGERRPVRVLSSTITSPTLQAALQRFLDTFPDGRHIVYDALSSSSILEAHRLTHGQRLLPRYRFENAEVVVSFDADFLGTWISPVEFTSGYHRGRNLHGTPRRCSYHVQFESRLSLTGCKADQRVVLLPGEIGLVLTHLAERVAQRAGVSFTANGLGPSPVAPEMLDALADRS